MSPRKAQTAGGGNDLMSREHASIVYNCSVLERFLELVPGPAHSMSTRNRYEIDALCDSSGFTLNIAGAVCLHSSLECWLSAFRRAVLEFLLPNLLNAVFS